jgi:predicted DNA-binding transcriptional regulator YafY
MAKSPQQKLKILYMMQAFWEKTDEQHPMSIRDITAYLGEFGIKAERKTIYDDIETLRVFGLDIRNRRSTPAGFYLADRKISLEDLGVIADVLQSARHLPENKAEQLIGTLEKLVSVHQSRQLHRPVSMDKRARTMKDSVYFNVNVIQTAIARERQVSFQYYEWTVSRKKKLEKNGERYFVSPWGILWKDGHAYLIAIDEKSHMVKYYRADQMLKIRMEEAARGGGEMFGSLDMETFAARTFRIFGSHDESVTLEFENHFIGEVLDFFGEEVRIVRRDDAHFDVLMRTDVNDRFLGWVSGLGPGVRILSPQSAQIAYRKFLRRALEHEEHKNDG